MQLEISGFQVCQLVGFSRFILGVYFQVFGVYAQWATGFTGEAPELYILIKMDNALISINDGALR